MEPTTSNNSINGVKEVRKLFNELRSNIYPAEIKRIRETLHKKETIYNFLKEKKQEDSLTNKEKKVLKKIIRYFKNSKKNYKKELEKLQKYNITYGLNYLFDEEDYYEPIEIKSAFDNSYILYENRRDKDAKLSLEDYFNIIKPYLKDMINNCKSHGEWKIQLSMKINFISSKNADESRTMNIKSDNIEIMIGTEYNDVINELSKSLFKRHQEGLETKIRGSNFIFERVELLEYYLHEISINGGSSYIDSPDWIKNKKATINPKNNDSKCFKYAVTAALNYKKLEKIYREYRNLDLLLIITIG